MNDKRTKLQSTGREFLCGFIIYAAVTLIARVITFVYTELSDGNAAAGLLDILIFFADSVIYACGAALIAHFIRLRDKRYRALSLLFVLLILALDYIGSYFLDLVMGNFVYLGQDIAAALLLLLNFIVRSLMYVIMIAFCGMIVSKRGEGEPPVPLFSRRHPVSRMITVASLVQVVPYLLFEIYSNIDGIIHYGWSMTTGDVLSILSAYAEIFIKGLVSYLTMYIVIAVLIKMHSSAKEENA